MTAAAKMKILTQVALEFLSFEYRINSTVLETMMRTTLENAMSSFQNDSGRLDNLV
jgi:hypothetical protein